MLMEDKSSQQPHPCIECFYLGQCGRDLLNDRQMLSTDDSSQCLKAQIETLKSCRRDFRIHCTCGKEDTPELESCDACKAAEFAYIFLATHSFEEYTPRHFIALGTILAKSSRDGDYETLADTRMLIRRGFLTAICLFVRNEIISAKQYMAANSALDLASAAIRNALVALPFDEPHAAIFLEDAQDHLVRARCSAGEQTGWMKVQRCLEAVFLGVFFLPKLPKLLR